MYDFELWHLLLVFLAGLIGESYGTVIGGGGILIQFVLATLGLPLHSVVATDMAGTLGSTLGVVTASPKSTWSNKKLIWILAIPTFIGGVIGAFLLININVMILKFILIIGLIVLLLRMFFMKATSTQLPHDVVLTPRQYPLIATVMTSLGIYGNVSGVGVGTFQRLAFISILRLKFVDSLGIGNLIVIPGTIFLFITAALAGLLVWPYLIALWIGTFLGGRYATKYIRKVPDNYLRSILVAIVLLYLVYLLMSLA